MAWERRAFYDQPRNNIRNFPKVEISLVWKFWEGVVVEISLVEIRQGNFPGIRNFPVEKTLKPINSLEYLAV